jgi:hypothetical protein
MTSPTPSPRLFQWFWDAPVLRASGALAAWLGWLLDAFDVMLYALVLGTLLGEFSLSKAMAGLLGSLTLVASGFGGILFGIIADRYGRRPALVGSLLVYSVFTFACGLSTTVWQLAVFRFLLGLGMGGELHAQGRCAVPKRGRTHRGKAMGMMQCALVGRLRRSRAGRRRGLPRRLAGGILHRHLPAFVACGSGGASRNRPMPGQVRAARLGDAPARFSPRTI